MTCVAAVKCDSYSLSMVIQKIEYAVAEAGGLPESFRKDSKILINPNFLTAKTPDQAATTHPVIVQALIHYLRKQGIHNLTIGDSPAGRYSWQELWDKTGFTAIANEENVPLLAFENAKRIEIPEVGTIPLLKELDEFDAVISVPKLKTHILTKVTGAVKNSYGLIIGGSKSSLHGNFPSPRKMSAFIGLFYQYVKPDFVVMDAIECMEKNGPADGDPVHLGIILAGQDAAAIDSCACQAYSYKSTDLEYLNTIRKQKLGETDIEKITQKGDGWDCIKNANLKRSKSDLLHRIPDALFSVVTGFLNCKPQVIQNACKSCGKCAEICSQHAISKNSENKYQIKKSKCILCVCCIEACPYHAIEMVSIGMRIRRLFKP